MGDNVIRSVPGASKSDASPAAKGVLSVRFTRLAIPDVLLIEPRVFGDVRGFFFESWNRAAFRDATGLDPDFVQDTH